MNFLTKATSIFIVFLNELSHALMVSGSSDLPVADAIQLYLEDNPDSNLANVLDSQQHERKFKAVAEDILETFLDSKAYNCEPVKVFLREILAGLILEMTLKSCSKPEWINGWIVYLLEEGEPEIMSVIDAGVDYANNKGLRTSSTERTPSTNSSPIMEFQQAPSNASASRNQKTISRAEDAMEEAMLEAKRLSELIAAEDAKNSQISDNSPALLSSSTISPSSFHNGSKGILQNNKGTEIGEEGSTALVYSKFLDSKHSISDDASSSIHPTGSSFTPSSSHSDLDGRANQFEYTPEGHGATMKESAIETPTTFEGLLSPQQLAASDVTTRPQSARPMTLHNASVTIFDDSLPGEKANSIIRSKPTVDYLLQVEPASSQYPGWMMARKYADFETLHEVLGRISVISGVTSFTRKYNTAPTWKNQTKTSLRNAMELYLRDALSHACLAESEGMKRFLEKDQTLQRLSGGSTGKGVVGFPSPTDFENMGKGMLDVLASAPKGVAGSGKALIEGVSGVFAQKKPPLPARPLVSSQSASITSNRRRTGGENSLGLSPQRNDRVSSESPRRSLETDTQNLPMSQAYSPVSDRTLPKSNGTTTNKSQPPKALNSLTISDEPAADARSVKKESSIKKPTEEPTLHLPPPPSEIPDDYSLKTDAIRSSVSTNDPAADSSSIESVPSSAQPSSNISFGNSSTLPKLPTASRSKPESLPLTEQETQVAVELFFAMINELYMLSSVWNIRRTLLNAAKTFLLRPGNPNLEAIRVLLQDTIIDANTSDVGLATHLKKLRENSLPTESELAAWPPALTEMEQEKLRVKARRLLIERGMPQALTSVMGAAASGEALGRIFDSLQVHDVARGLMFAMFLQGIRAMTH